MAILLLNEETLVRVDNRNGLTVAQFAVVPFNNERQGSRQAVIKWLVSKVSLFVRASLVRLELEELQHRVQSCYSSWSEVLCQVQYV
jgi:hypothetical protein